jgi:gamma-glutamyl phosphate reductase
MSIETLLSEISSGAHDSSLGKINEAVAKRLKTVRKERTINDYNIGDKVKFNEQTGTRYMVGETATIVSKRRTKVVVRLDSPTGRFARVNPATHQVESSNVTCPVGILDLI